MPQRDENVWFDQALFGYADGHRLLASSVRLSSRDMYDLAEVSDLASNVRLNSDEGYLTGLPLQESGTYVLMKTWAAPEMPRPGSVWSHVLLVHDGVLDNAIDLRPITRLFRRPEVDKARAHDSAYEGYKARLQITNSTSGEIASRTISEHIISKYYRGLPTFLTPDLGTGEIECAILAVWSQQWPKLRRTFRFRTAELERLPKAAERVFDVQIGSAEGSTDEVELNSSSREWIEAGASDAIVFEMSALRTFLWQYGADVDAPRKRYQTLIRLFQSLSQFHDGSLPATWAKTIYSTFADDACQLKTDVLGTGNSQSKFFNPISIPDFLALVANSSDSDPPLITEEQFRSRIKSMRPSEVLSVALTYAELRKPLASRSDTIEEAIASEANERLIRNSSVPPWLVADILSRRVDLIDEQTLKRLDPELGFRLLQSVSANYATAALFQHWMVQDPKRYGEELLAKYTDAILLAAANAYTSGKLHPRWREIIVRQANELVRDADLTRFETVGELGEFATLLKFPTQKASVVFPRWLDAAKRAQSVIKATSIPLAAYLVTLNLKVDDESAAGGFMFGLADLWKAVSSDDICDEVRELLRRQLPDIGYSNWDLCKRLLIALSNANRYGILPKKLLNELHLTPSQESILEKGSGEESPGWLFRWW